MARVLHSKMIIGGNSVLPEKFMESKNHRTFMVNNLMSREVDGFALRETVHQPELRFQTFA